MNQDEKSTDAIEYGNEASNGEDNSIEQYDLVSVPNDYTVEAIKTYLSKGQIYIPKYQRRYVWDKKQASKLIESLVLGLPVPQVFLFEESRNKSQIIDGQQRLLSIFFFMIGRFPKKDARNRLSEIWLGKNELNQDFLNDNKYFEDFRLKFDKVEGGIPHHLDGETFNSLDEEYGFTLNGQLRVIKIKQVAPNGMSAVYEIFNRLNTTGVNLTPQEIRLSLRESYFIDSLVDFNSNVHWRNVLNVKEPDPKYKDTEILLRLIALGISYKEYNPSLKKFLDTFVEMAVRLDEKDVDSEFTFLENFMKEISLLDRAKYTFDGKLSVPVLEAIYAACRINSTQNPDFDKLDELMKSEDFTKHSFDKTTDKENVRGRILEASKILFNNVLTFDD